MSQFLWPPVVATNPSVGVTGTTAPTSATEVGGVNAGNLVPIAVTASGSVIVDGSGTPVPVSGTVTANQGTPGVGAWPVLAAQSGTWNITNISGTVSLPAGASTSALQTSGNTTLTAISAQLPATLGQKAMSASLPVTIASDQSSFPISGTVAATQSGTWNITNISGTVSLPTGAATSALQTTISGQLPATLGQKAMAASLPVVIASDQASFPVSGTVTANQGTANTPTNAWPVYTQDLTVSGPASQSTATNNILASDGTTPTDAADYRSISIQINSTATAGTIIFEASNDNSTWSAVPVTDITTTGSSAPLTSYTPANSTRIWGGPLFTRYFRVRISSGLTGGVVQAFAKLSAENYAPLAQVVQQNTAGSLNANITNISGTVSLPTGAATAALQAKVPIAPTGSYAEITNLTNVAQTFTAPANAIGFLLEYPAISANTDNVRWKVGATATTSSGMRLEPGRDSGFMPVGANISVITEGSATNQTITVQWVTQ